jgi:hypothetical protein
MLTVKLLREAERHTDRENQEAMITGFGEKTQAADIFF